MAEEAKSLYEEGNFSEETLSVALSCLAQCIIELFADGGALPVSIAFRNSIFFFVGVNFLKGYIGAGNTIPCKLVYALLGFAIYFVYSISR